MRPASRLLPPRQGAFFDNSQTAIAGRGKEEVRGEDEFDIPHWTRRTWQAIFGPPTMRPRDARFSRTEQSETTHDQ